MLRYQETNPVGSFTAQGTGFLYEYNASTRTLRVFYADTLETAVEAALIEAQAGDAPDFVWLFERTAQIDALRFSNRETFDITDTLDRPRLSPILHRILRVAGYALALKNEQFLDFEKLFLADHDLKKIEFAKAVQRSGTDLYTAALQTSQDNKAIARSSTLSGTAAYLSDRILVDIIAKEYGHGVDPLLHGLLSVAATLTTLSLVINNRFDPTRKSRKRSGALFSLLENMPKNNDKSVY